MIKVIILDTRKEGWEYEEFREYWLTEHAPLAEQLPNLRKYTISLPEDPESHPYDGVAELWFDDVKAMEAAFASDIGERVEKDAASFIDVENKVVMTAEERVQLDELGED